jgi:hypothetical protein
MKQELKGMRVADVAEVQRESLAVLDRIPVENLRKRFQEWERRWVRCNQSHGSILKGTKISDF